MARSTVSARKPRGAEASEGSPKPARVVDDTSMKAITTSVRKDLWRELSKLALGQDTTIQVVVNRAIYQYLTSQDYTIAIPLQDGDA